MTTNEDVPEGLLAELLENQYLTAQEDKVYFSDERLLAAIKGKQRFSRAEQQQLLRSPLTRRRLVLLTRVVRAQVYSKWAEHGIQVGTLEVMAAKETDETVARHDYDSDLYRLSLIPLDAAGEDWEICIRFFEQLQQDAADSCIRLVDDGGQVWVTGRPDKNGELHDYWSLPESPVSRLFQHRLRLEPY